jgi:hypothetical protein
MIINGNTYHIPELDFNAMCKLEDMGVNLMQMENKTFMLVRGLLALAMKTDLEGAGKELESHIINGGRLEDLTEEINKAVTESGFFRALQQSQKKGDPAGESAEAKEITA